MVISELGNPLIVDIVPCLSIFHYVYELIAIQHCAPPALILSCTFISSIFNLSILSCFLSVIIKVARTNRLKHMPRHTHVFLDSFWVASIVEYKWRLSCRGDHAVISVYTVHGALSRGCRFHIPQWGLSNPACFIHLFWKIIIWLRVD